MVDEEKGNGIMLNSIGKVNYCNELTSPSAVRIPWTDRQTDRWIDADFQERQMAFNIINSLAEVEKCDFKEIQLLLPQQRLIPLVSEAPTVLHPRNRGSNDLKSTI